MRMRSNFLYMLLILHAGVVGAVSSIPPPLNFENYAVNVEDGLPTKKIILSTPLAKSYKTIITTDGEKEANFSGYSRVVVWGCGTDCRAFAIVNKKTGVAYTPKGIKSVVGLMNNDDDRLSFKLNSRLFIVVGGINEVDYGKFYYYWDDRRLKLLYKEALSASNQ